MKLLLYRSPNKPSPAARLRQSCFPCHELSQTLPSQEPPRLCSRLLGSCPRGPGLLQAQLLMLKQKLGGSPPVHGPSRLPAGSQGGKVPTKFRFPVRLQLINQAWAPEVRSGWALAGGTSSGPLTELPPPARSYLRKAPPSHHRSCRVGFPPPFPFPS